MLKTQNHDKYVWRFEGAVHLTLRSKGIMQVKGSTQHNPCAKNASNQSRGTFRSVKNGEVR